MAENTYTGATEAKFTFVDNSEDWKKIPDIFKGVQWFRREVEVPGREDIKFKSVPKLVELDHNGVTKLVVVPGLIGSLARKKGCTVKGVVFGNFIRIDADLVNDDDTGAFAIRVNGVNVIKQGGYKGFVPSNMDKDDEEGTYHFDQGFHTNCNYEADPFEGRA